MQSAVLPTAERKHLLTAIGMNKDTESDGSALLDLTVDPKKSCYPFCLVWTPIPGFTALIPFIGHMGIADSKGFIYDFAGPCKFSRLAWNDYKLEKISVDKVIVSFV